MHMDVQMKYVNRTNRRPTCKQGKLFPYDCVTHTEENYYSSAQNFYFLYLLNKKIKKYSKFYIPFKKNKV